MNYIIYPKVFVNCGAWFDKFKVGIWKCCPHYMFIEGFHLRWDVLEIPSFVFLCSCNHPLSTQHTPYHSRMDLNDATFGPLLYAFASKTTQNRIGWVVPPLLQNIWNIHFLNFILYRLCFYLCRKDLFFPTWIIVVKVTKLLILGAIFANSWKNNVFHPFFNSI